MTAQASIFGKSQRLVTLSDCFAVREKVHADGRSMSASSGRFMNVNVQLLLFHIAPGIGGIDISWRVAAPRLYLEPTSLFADDINLRAL